MANVLVLEIQELDFVVFDFDGTLIRLNVNWSLIRDELGLRSIEDIWRRPHSVQSKEWRKVSDAEIEALTSSNAILSTMSLLPLVRFGILTNNCEEVVNRFLEDIGMNSAMIPVVGRDWLGKSKKDLERFRQAIDHIVPKEMPAGQLLNESFGYLGDSTYELDFAFELGFKTYRVERDGTIVKYQGAKG